MKQINIVNLSHPLNEETTAQIKAHFEDEEEQEVTLNIKRYSVQLDTSADGNVEDRIEAIASLIIEDFSLNNVWKEIDAVVPAGYGPAAHIFASCYDFISCAKVLLITSPRGVTPPQWRLTQVF